MRRSLWICLLISLFFLIVAGCSSSAEPTAVPTPTPLPTAVKPTFTVQRGEIMIKTDLEGRVVPVNSKPASFTTDGKIGNVYVQVGDRVEQGQLLADLDVMKDLEDQWAKASADAKYEEAVSNNTIKRTQIKLQIAQLTLEDLKAKGASPAEIQIADLQAQLAQMDLDEIKANPALHTASAKAQELERAMADAQLKAPLAGYIVSAPKSGQSVRAGNDAFLIGDVSQLEIGANATEDVLKQLTEGLTVTVAFEDNPNKQKYVGTIRQLPYPYGSGGNGATDVRISLAATPDQAGYKLGDRALMTAVLEDKPDILWLPPQAIRNVGGRTFVVAQDGKGQQRVDVTLGLQVYDKVEITSGLAEGQVVVGP
ncbi:MAG TPA: efflux RND transporter periplasmic adaptor subunit [Anaerolineae bacterium]|nr:efflux RND transporter periplasmic adaptor subunit [Anaerolineae bacterium]